MEETLLLKKLLDELEEDEEEDPHKLSGVTPELAWQVRGSYPPPPTEM